MINRRTIVWLIAAMCLAIALILWLSVLGPSNVPVILAKPLQAETEQDSWVGHTPQPAHFAVHNATAEDLGRLGEAVMAFATAGLELPTLDVWFHTDRQSCGEYHGRFRATSKSWQIRICSSEITSVVVHELAHAWITANIDDTRRSAFMDLRGLEHWADRDIPWNERGTEWAAVIIQQGLSGLPLPPALSNDTRSRLQSFELLTGRIAPPLVEWITEREVPCSNRPTDLSRPIADGSGRTCAVFHPVVQCTTRRRHLPPLFGFYPIQELHPAQNNNRSRTESHISETERQWSTYRSGWSRDEMDAAESIIPAGCTG